MPYSIMVKTLNYIIVLLICVASHSISVMAVERIDFKVNDDITTAVQNSPKIAVAIDHTFVITWVDRREGTSDIFVQRYNSYGFPIGTNLKINDDTNSSYQFEPAIAIELSGRYSLVWKDYRTGSYPFNPEIFTQRFDAAFTLVDTNLQISKELPLTMRETPDIAISDSKREIVVWADYRNSNWDIYGQLIASDGSQIGNNFLVNDDITNAQQHRPRVSISNQGWFVVTWYENRFGDDDIFAQVFDSMGTPVDTNIRVNQEYDGFKQAFPDVTTDGAGNFTVVWVDWRNGEYPADPDIYSRKYTSAMVPVTTEILVNTDGAATAQREPAISSDRLGNVAIIWADSIGKSWDISGQMIDVDGIIREENFKANTDTDSAQVSPDVAIDGQQRYVTWVDRRNGNYDIYASIQIYNNPSLAASESFKQFIMQEGDPVPDSQTLVIDHVGYNSLGFTVISDMDWLDISPTTSMTTDTLTLVVNTDTLSHGLYTGNLIFVDTLLNDSSLSVAVQLTVFTPTMQLSEDTLRYTFFEGIADSGTTKLIVKNSSMGTFSWTAIENASWLTASSYAGNASDSLIIDVDPSGLSSGSYSEQMVFSSPDASGAPDTLIVELEVVNNQPYIVVAPDSIFIYTDSIINYSFPVVVTNFGADTLAWTATANGNWFTYDTLSGTDGDSILFLVDSTIVHGRYTGYVEITDSLSYNKSIRVPLIFDYYQTSEDTLQFGSTNSATIQTVAISLTLNAVNNLTQIHLPFQFDTTYLSLDSIVKGVTTPDLTIISYTVNNTNGTAIFNLTMNQADTSLNLGLSHVAELYFKTKTVLGIGDVETIITDSINANVLDTASQRFAPSVVSGFVDVDVATDIADDLNLALPERVNLQQNYPNPFNISTTIEYSLPTRSNVELNIYNILGQRIRILMQQSQPAGNYQVTWNGHYDDNRVAPSGIYFYRLETISDILVKKMVLLK